MTVRARRGTSTVIPLRLCCRALRMTTRSGDEGITCKDSGWASPNVISAHMALALTPRLLRRGLELFALISLAGVGGPLLDGRHHAAFSPAPVGLRRRWLVPS